MMNRISRSGFYDNYIQHHAILTEFPKKFPKNPTRILQRIPKEFPKTFPKYSEDFENTRSGFYDNTYNIMRNIYYT